MSRDIKELIGTARKYADAIDKDRGFESGLTDCLRGLADAIEALEREVERLTTNGIHTCHDQCQRLPCVQGREIRRLEGEVARLREALEFIARGTTGSPDAIAARKALEDDKQ